MNPPRVAIIGAGLAGCECALALAQKGIYVTLFEMKPHKFSPAHTLSFCSELVCSNSFRSNSLDSAVGLLKQEMRFLGSASMDVAMQCQVPAGKSLAVDRELFAKEITRRIEEHPLITLARQEITELNPQKNSVLAPFTKIVVAAGPLASDALVQSLGQFTGKEYLYFYDAIAPVVDGESVNMDIAFWGSRYAPEESDYLNCPMSKEEYMHFYAALLESEKVATRDFEEEKHFEGCMPIESLATRGERTLVFGPLKPVGFEDPRTGMRPYAILQLRMENTNKTMFNLVGCQTKLTYAEQARVFRLVPGLEQVQFVRFGSMHRNTFIHAPTLLQADLSLTTAPQVHLAGQITGVEGYVESAATGLWLGLVLAASIHGTTLPSPPPETALGALLQHLQTPEKRFQPSNVQFGLMPALNQRAKKAERKILYQKRAEQAFANWCHEVKVL